MRVAALIVRFALELCVLASLAVLATHLPVETWAQAVLGILLCITAAAIWGAFLSPKRRYEMSLVGRLVLEAGFFLSAALILAYINWPTVAIVLIVVATADRIALAFTR